MHTCEHAKSTADKRFRLESRTVSLLTWECPSDMATEPDPPYIKKSCFSITLSYCGRQNVYLLVNLSRTPNYNLDGGHSFPKDRH